MSFARMIPSLAGCLAVAWTALPAAQADGPWTMTDLRIVGFEAVSLPPRVARGRAAEPGEMYFLLRHAQRGERYACTVSVNPRNGNLVDDRCLRLRSGETPEARLGLPEID